MWLDRFSNQSTPARFSNQSTPAGSPPLNRSNSPHPIRKSSHLAPPQRNGISSLTASRQPSSLDLGFNSSSSSLPLGDRLSNGSVLRYEHKPPENVEDPLLVLRGVLGINKNAVTPSSKSSTVDIHEAEHIDFAGLGLEQYITQNVGASDNYPNPSTRYASIIQHRDGFKQFRTSIAECDDSLNSVESYLTNFKAELGQVSAEIESLQARSIRLNSQLDNRRKVEKLLGPAVEELSVSPAIVRSISDGPVDETFGKALVEVEARYLSVKAKHKDDDTDQVVEDILPLLENLKTRAVERIRDYLVAQIKSLRSPNINAQIIQQRTFLRHKEMLPFLSRNHSVLAEEIGQAYSNTMRWYLSSNFTRYRVALDKLPLQPSNEADLLGSDPATARRNLLGGTKGSHLQQDPFSLGKRADILRTKNETALPSYLAEDSKSVHHIETPFRNYNLALVDNASAEYSFVTEFFSNNTYQQVSRRVNHILDPCFNFGHELTKNLVENSIDCLGILICVRLNQHLAFETQKRKVPVLDSYINYTNILLWPRFQKIMDLHCESLRKVPTTTARSTVAAFSLIGGTDASKASMSPHLITQRFGQFLHGILTLSADAGDDEPVANSLTRLRTEYETLMGKLARGAGDAAKRGRFLYNNYSLVVTIIGDTHGKLAEEQKEHFSSLVRDHMPR